MPADLIIIDDQISTPTLIRVVLERVYNMAPGAIHIENNPVRGLAWIQANIPQMVICDTSMPGLHGIDVLQAMRADPTTAHIPFILMGVDIVDFKAHHIKADGYLQQPISIPNLIQVIETIMYGP